MKLGSLVDESLKGLGMRFNLIGIIPTMLLFLFILALLWSGAPGSPPKLCMVVKKIEKLQVNDAIFFTLAILAFALIIQPLQLSMVKILEGYWGASWPGTMLARLGIRIQRWKRQRLEVQTRSTRQVTPAEQERMGAASWRLHRYYPAKKQLLPTALGNVLRAAEINSGKRYGHDAVVVWPRLYPLLSEKVTTILADQRNQLDLAVRFCVMFIVAFLVSIILLIRFGWWLIVPAVTLLLAWLSYRAAIAAALAYGEGIKTAFDLHRFDLLKALHLPLPPDRKTEREANQALSDFLRQGVPENFLYDHPADN